MKLSIPNKKDFISNVLNPVSNLNDKTIIKIEKNKISSITASNDATLVLYSETEVNIDADRSINIPDIKKLVRVLECVDTEHLDLEVSSNNIKYAGDNFKFTYHLLEDGIIKIPSINVKKINELKFDTTFKVTENMLSSLFKGSSFTTETNKLYLYTQDGRLKGELTDRARHNTDVFALDLGEANFDLSPLPVNFDNIKLLSFIGEDINFGINTEYGVTVIDISNTNIKLKYIITSLTQ